MPRVVVDTRHALRAIGGLIMRVPSSGRGYVGLVAGACLAETGNDVVCADVDDGQDRAAAAQRDPDLRARARAAWCARNQAEGRLSSPPTSAGAVQHGRVVFIAVGTPPGEDGSADLQHVLGGRRAPSAST